MANLNTILEDQVSFAAANAQSIANILGSPPDGANAYSGAVLTANSAGAAEGHWQFSSSGGVSWASLPTNVSANAGLLLSADTLIRFQPARDFNGTPGALHLRPLTMSDLPWAKTGIPYGNQEGFLISWTSNGQDGSSNGIYAQRYNADGSPNGGEFQVNTHTSSDQHRHYTNGNN